MIRKSIKDIIMCENDRLRELMNMPISKILSYRDTSDSVDPEEALRYLADRYIENCGISLGMRGFYDYCASYWIEKLDLVNNPVLEEKYHAASTLGQIIPYITNNYCEDLLDKYDSCFMEAVDLRNILIELLETETEEKTKIILCAGICHCLSWANIGFEWLDQFNQSEIEEGIINYRNRDLIIYRHNKDFQRYRRWRYANDSETHGELPKCVEFTEEEIKHFVLLNDRLVELQHELMDQIKVITANLQEQIANGFHQYDTFCTDGNIYIDTYEDDKTDELLDTITTYAKYSVLHTNDDTKIEALESDISDERHWYGNWSGVFHILEETHGVRLCRAFVDLFEEYELFTIDDIMQIKPEMLFTHIEINI